MFTVDAAGRVRVPLSGVLDFETSRFYTLVVRVTDGGGLITEQTLRVDIIDRCG